MSQPLNAVVLGGTGAIGRELVGQLLCDSKWGRVTAVGRRAAEPPAEYRGQPGFDESKLQQAVVNMDHLEAEAASAFAGADSVFCCLGTTRAAAGSAEAFKKVDLDYVEASVHATAAAGVPHFSLVSAQGARAGVWASHWRIFHGLLYMQCKGKAEEAVKAQQFPYATILQPGLLERGDLARGSERLFAKLVNSVPASQVACTMRLDAERWHAVHGAAAAAAAGPGGGDAVAAAEPQVKVLDMKAIQQYQ